MCISLPLLASCSSRDGKAFEQVEAIYNDGSIDEARQLYEQFIVEYPTSKWRQTAELQLGRCREIEQLRSDAQQYESSNDYDAAINAYIKIFSMNSASVDTGVVLAQLRTDRDAYLEQLRIEEAHRDSIACAQAEASEKAFRKTLKQYADELEEWAGGISTTVRISISRASDYGEFGNAFIADVITSVINADEYQASMAEIERYYGNLVDVPMRYDTTRSDITSTHSHYQNLVYTLTHLGEYSRVTLRDRHAELQSLIASGIRSLRESI